DRAQPPLPTDAPSSCEPAAASTDTPESVRATTRRQAVRATVDAVRGGRVCLAWVNACRLPSVSREAHGAPGTWLVRGVRPIVAGTGGQMCRIFRFRRRSGRLPAAAGLRPVPGSGPTRR